MPIGTAAAILGSALLGGGASLFAAKQQKKAAQQALQQQQQATGQALDFQREAHWTNQANIAPYLGIGYGALGKVHDVMAGSPGWDNFLRSPDYKFRFGEGMRGLENSAAARGGLLSGNFLRAAQDYGQRSASQEFGNYFNRIMDVARLGQNSAVGAGSLANQSAGQVGQTTMAGAGAASGLLNAGGAAAASGPVGAVNALTGGVQNYLMFNALQNRPSAYGGMAPYSGAAPITSYLGPGVQGPVDPRLAY